MTTVYEGQYFERVFLDAPCQEYSDIEFRRCSFRFCVFSNCDDPRYRSVIRRVSLRNCEFIEPPGIDSAIVEDAMIENLKTRGLLQTWALAFKHVTLRGRIGRVMITNATAPISSTTPAQRHAWELANAEYYKTVDWALDISQAEFQECSIRGVPARLIKRDPETQVVVTREKARQGRWRELDLERTYWQMALDNLLYFEHEDVVLVAPKRSRDFRELMHGLQLLRDAGVTEAD